MNGFEIFMNSDTNPPPSKPRMNKTIWILITVVVVIVVIAASVSYVVLNQKHTTAPTLTVSQQTLSMTAADVPVLDPATGSDNIFLETMTNVYDELVQPTANGTYVGDLATSWNVSSSGLIWTFNLRPNVAFHNGDIVNASDVVWSFDRFVTMGSGMSYLFTPYVTNCTALNNMTVQFTLSSSFGPFLGALTVFYILDEKQVMNHIATGAYGQYGDYGDNWLLTHDAGSGPYMVTAVNLETNVTLTEFANYWMGTNAKQPKYVNIIGSEQTSTVTALFDSKEIQITDYSQTYTTISSLAKQSGASIATVGVGGENYLEFNTQLAPTNDIYVREALSYAFNYSAMLASSGWEGYQPSAGPVPIGFPGEWSGFPVWEQNMTFAKQIIKQSPYYGKLSNYPIKFYYTTAVPAEEQEAEIFASTASELGLTVNIVGVPWTNYWDDAMNKTTSPNCIIYTMSSTYPEAGAMLDEIFTMGAQGTGYQIYWLNNTSISNQIAKALSLSNQTARFNAYYQAEKMIHNEYLNIYACDDPEIMAYYSNIVYWPAAHGNAPPVMGWQYEYRNFEFNASLMPA